MTNKFSKLIAALVLMAPLAFAQFVQVQNYPTWAQLTTSTTLSASIAAASPSFNQTTNVCVASSTGINLPSLAGSVDGSYLLIDEEVVLVERAGLGPSTCYNVRRGVLGSTAAPHTINALVWVANPTAVGGSDTSRPFVYPIFPLNVGNYMQAPTPVSLPGTTFNALGPTSGTMYYGQIWVPENRAANGICIANGGTVGTNNHLVALYSEQGTLIANSAVAGVLAANASAYQCIAFTNPVELSGPRAYYGAFQANGSTAVVDTYAANSVPSSYVTGSITGTFGTVPASITIGSTFTANVGPAMTLY